MASTRTSAPSTSATRWPWLAPILVLPLAGCFTTSADFKNDAEDFIESNVSEELDVEFTTVTCDDPESQDVGTTFLCSAIDDQNESWTFEVEIVSDNEYVVDIFRGG